MWKWKASLQQNTRNKFRRENPQLRAPSSQHIGQFTQSKYRPTWKMHKRAGKWAMEAVRGRGRNGRLSSNSLLVKSENQSLAKNKIYWRLKWHFCRKWKHCWHGSGWLGVLHGRPGAMGRPRAMGRPPGAGNSRSLELWSRLWARFQQVEAPLWHGPYL